MKVEERNHEPHRQPLSYSAVQVSERLRGNLTNNGGKHDHLGRQALHGRKSKPVLQSRRKFLVIGVQYTPI